ncbi:hypothetical protein ALT761_00917 [Alteromonas sp. 76-1]|uniref:hypothetical protein n=1 Tax=Alteromonas sp. 76-1 TaxID=2358187 RepID=UPI000FD18758|nr:hypothetical protein [Alteromonas sp. 76-1]VEL95958.1 hypothetical protein ALT761_00917 [Alteromonas sp. 76-1]
MSNISPDKSQSIIETSLTELAFIFFFILLAFAALKIGELVAKEDEALQENEQLEAQLDKVQQDNNTLIATSLSIRDAVNSPSMISPDAVFDGLAEDTSKAINYIQRQKDLEAQLPEKEMGAEQLDHYINVVKILQAANDAQDEKFLDETPEELAERLMDDMQMLKGQNANLRQRLGDEGNGLDHPPCWADEVGNIQFVYQVTIHEDHLLVDRAWPDVLQSRVDGMPFITEALGQYGTRRAFWAATNMLYQDSVAKECRHFVKIVDKADSKDSFKSYLIAIERHFYKLLL